MSPREERQKRERGRGLIPEIPEMRMKFGDESSGREAEERERQRETEIEID